MPKSKHTQSGTSPSAKSVSVELDRTPNHHPILCSFPSGVPEQNQTKAQFQLRQEGNTACVVGKDEACHYKASSNKSTKKRRIQFVVGVWNPNTKQLRLQPTSHNGSVFTMSQSVPNYQSSISTSNLKAGAEQYRALFQDFGSAKKQKAIRSQEANRVSVDSVVGGGGQVWKNMKMSASNVQRFAERQAAGEDETDNVLSTASLAVQAATDQWRTAFLPRFDSTAKHPCGVYQLSSIAGPSVLAHLQRIVDICQTKSNVGEALVHGQEWKPSLIHVLENTILTVNQQQQQDKASQHVTTTTRQLQTLLLLHIWTTIYSMMCSKRFVSMHSSGRFFGQPGVVAERFMELFATETVRPHHEVKYTMSKANKDRALVFLLILYCLASSSGVGLSGTHLERLANDLQLESSTVSHLLRQAGFVVKKKSSSGLTATLSLPLTFPKPKMARGQR